MLEWAPSLSGLWKERHATIQDKKFTYFESPGDKKPMAVLNFDLFEGNVDPYEKDKAQFNLSLLGKDHKFFFKAANKEASVLWQTVLKKHIRSSEGFL